MYCRVREWLSTEEKIWSICFIGFSLHIPHGAIQMDSLKKKKKKKSATTNRESLQPVLEKGDYVLCGASLYIHYEVCWDVCPLEMAWIKWLTGQNSPVTSTSQLKPDNTLNSGSWCAVVMHLTLVATLDGHLEIPQRQSPALRWSTDWDAPWGTITARVPIRPRNQVLISLNHWSQWKIIQQGHQPHKFLFKITTRKQVLHLGRVTGLSLFNFGTCYSRM